MTTKTAAEITSEVCSFISDARTWGFSVTLLGRAVRLSKNNEAGNADQFEDSCQKAHLLMARLPANGDRHGSGFGGYGDAVDIQNGTFSTALCGITSRYATILKKYL